MITRVYPRRWAANERISALKLNQTVDAVRDLYAQTGQVQQQIEAARELDLQVVKFASFPPFDGSSPRPYLICETLDAMPQQLNVGKPPLIRGEAAHGGATFTYTSDTERQANGSEDQVLIPNYDVGDQILILPCATGLLDENDNVISWIDINASARYWAKVVSTP